MEGIIEKNMLAEPTPCIKNPPRYPAACGGVGLIGHAAQLDFLKKSWHAGRLAQAYIFSGPESVGKRHVAKELASLVLGRDLAKNLSEEYGLLYLERTTDLKTGKKHKDITKKDIEKTRDFLQHGAFLAGYKLVIINEAEFLNEEASNAFLKTLEEPTPQSVVILLVDDEKKLLPTVVSRCQIVHFYPVPENIIYQALIAKDLDRETARDLTRRSQRLPGVALSLLEAENKDFYYTEAERFLDLQQGDYKQKFALLEPLFGKKEDHTQHIEARDKLVKILQVWTGFWRDLLLCQEQAEELISNTLYIDRLRALSQRQSRKRLTILIKAGDRAKTLLRQNIHPRLLVENLVLIM